MRPPAYSREVDDARSIGSSAFPMGHATTGAGARCVLKVLMLRSEASDVAHPGTLGARGGERHTDNTVVVTAGGTSPDSCYQPDGFRRRRSVRRR
jgi:hypothetical protein